MHFNGQNLRAVLDQLSFTQKFFWVKNAKIEENIRGLSVVFNEIEVHVVTNGSTLLHKHIMKGLHCVVNYTVIFDNMFSSRTMDKHMQVEELQRKV